MSEGYRGTDLEHGQGEISGSNTADLNTLKEDLPGQKPQDPIVNEDEAMAAAEDLAAEDLAADAVNMFMDLVHNPEKLKALESDPDAMGQFKQLMNTEIPFVDPKKVMQKASRNRELTMKLPDLEAESLRLRKEAASRHQCANCGKALTGNQLYYCSDTCKAEFYNRHPTSISWNEVRQKALDRDLNKCVKCGKLAEEVDHIMEI